MEKKEQIRLVKKAKEGNAQAFVTLCEMYQVILYNSAYKLLLNDEDIADCLQETEIRAWKKIPGLKNEEAFNSWLFKIMINTAKDILKKRVEMLELEEYHLQTKETETEKFSLEEDLNKLSDKYKIPLILYYYSGFSVQEIAEQLEIPKNTIKTRLARGREQLKFLMEE